MKVEDLTEEQKEALIKWANENLPKLGELLKAIGEWYMAVMNNLIEWMKEDLEKHGKTTEI